MGKKSFFAAIFVILNLTCLKANAQQTIINVPSANVLNKGQLYGFLAADSFKPYNPGAYANIQSYLLYGLGHNTEVIGGIAGLVFPNNISPILPLGAKKVFFITNYTKLTIVPLIFPHLNEAVTPLNLDVIHLSQEIPKIQTRFTAGIYLANGKSFLPSKVGTVLGFEQPLFNKKITLVTDWISRNESYGFYAAGIKIAPGKGFSTTSAVQIPNGNKAKFGFVFYLRYDFSELYKKNTIQ